jgi:hypothetical protein
MLKRMAVAVPVFTFGAEVGAHPVGNRSGEWSVPGHEQRPVRGMTRRKSSPIPS